MPGAQVGRRRQPWSHDVCAYIDDTKGNANWQHRSVHESQMKVLVCRCKLALVGPL